MINEGMRVSNESLQLNKHWTLGEPLGDGGYGKVVAATGEDGTRAAVKLVPKKPGASRELLFVDLALPGQAVRTWSRYWTRARPKTRTRSSCRSPRSHCVTGSSPSVAPCRSSRP